ncbi:MAG: flagellar hook-length control protein FliK, partial [Lachnospiraceae bacterium]|nr:flagellar hook-length control protein FliK [Lachnospiraceae bacterium]
DAGEVALNPEGLDIDELLGQIKDYLKSQMDLTDEEIERAFYECGLNAFSVLQLDNLQQFFVNVNGMEDFSEVLTDGGLMDAWNSLVSGLSELKLMLGDGIAVDASVFSELSENDDIFEAVSKYLADKSKAGAEDGQITENANVPEDVLQDSVVDGSMQTDGSESGNGGFADGGFGTSELNTGVERDNDIKPAAFDENLFQTFIHNIQESVADSDRFDHNQIQQIRDIAFQIIEGVKVNVKADTSSLEIQLNPEALGKVNVAIELKDGIATANFIVRNEMARVAVESQLQTLKDTFEEQGLKVEAVSVTVSDFSFDQRRQAFSEREDGRGGSTGKRRTVIDRIDSAADEPAADEEIIENEAAGTEHGINITA